MKKIASSEDLLIWQRSPWQRQWTDVHEPFQIDIRSTRANITLTLLQGKRENPCQEKEQDSQRLTLSNSLITTMFREEYIYSVESRALRSKQPGRIRKWKGRILFIYYILSLEKWTDFYIINFVTYNRYCKISSNSRISSTLNWRDLF